MFRLISTLVVAFSLVQVATAQECKQSYSPWMQRVSQTGVYYYCQYTFEPTPGNVQTNWVIWYPTEGDAKFLYFSNSKGKYWCRALNEFHTDYQADQPKWNVVARDQDKKALLNELPMNAWGTAQHPICPGSNVDGKPGCPMLKPPAPPKELYASYLAQGR